MPDVYVSDDGPAALVDAAHDCGAAVFLNNMTTCWAQVILTGSEDGSVRIWHSTTYRLENTLNYGMERVWALAYVKGSNS